MTSYFYATMGVLNLAVFGCHEIATVAGMELTVGRSHASIVCLVLGIWFLESARVK